MALKGACPLEGRGKLAGMGQRVFGRWSRGQPAWNSQVETAGTELKKELVSQLGALGFISLDRDTTRAACWEDGDRPTWGEGAGKEPSGGEGHNHSC